MELSLPEIQAPAELFTPELARALPDPEALARSARAHLAPPDVGPMAECGAPLADLVASPLGLRAAALGIARGRAFYHHELRVRLPMPPDAAPPLDVWGGASRAGSTVPLWRDGVLAEPKYFSFFQDDPLASYNPNHRGKWRAHEMLHGAIPFVWSPTMTRFEIYAGARLQELLPVVHWYGWDEIARARCAAHIVDPGPPAARCEACERAGALGPALRDLDAARRARSHFDREWRASLAEAESGRPQPTPAGGLDASSDAVGYAQAHAPRLYSWHVGAWIERFARRGDDYVETLEACARGVARAALALTSGMIELDEARARAERSRRAASDLGKRALLAIELGWVERARVSRPLDRLAEAAASPEAGAIAEAAAALLEAAACPALGALGHAWLGESSIEASVEQLADGLRSACPTVALALEGASIDAREASVELALDPDFGRAESLARRAARWLERGTYPELAELARLEGWLAAEPRSDPDASRFAMRPDPEHVLNEAAYLGAFRLHATTRRAGWSGDALAALFGEAFDESAEEVELAAAVDPGGELVVVLPTAAHCAALAALADGAPLKGHEAALLELEADGLVVWRPTRSARAE